jgi:hypothetical protein
VTLFLFLPLVTESGWKARNNLFASHRGFNGINRSTLNAIEREGLENAVVFVEGAGTWFSYGKVFSVMSPYLDDSVLYARDGGVHNVPKPGNEPMDNMKLKDIFPDRIFYRFRNGQITPLDF